MTTYRVKLQASKLDDERAAILEITNAASKLLPQSSTRVTRQGGTILVECVDHAEVADPNELPPPDFQAQTVLPA